MQALRNIMSKMNCQLLRPRFPVIIDTGIGLISARSWPILERRLAKITFPDNARRDVIDATGQKFVLIPENFLFAPLLFKKPWSKRAIVDLYNGKKDAVQAAYPTASLSTKRLEQVIEDIAGLLSPSRPVIDNETNQGGRQIIARRPPTN